MEPANVPQASSPSGQWHLPRLPRPPRPSCACLWRTLGDCLLPSLPRVYRLSYFYGWSSTIQKCSRRWWAMPLLSQCRETFKLVCTWNQTRLVIFFFPLSCQKLTVKWVEMEQRLWPSPAEWDQDTWVCSPPVPLITCPFTEKKILSV